MLARVPEGLRCVETSRQPTVVRFLFAVKPLERRCGEVPASGCAKLLPHLLAALLCLMLVMWALPDQLDVVPGSLPAAGAHMVGMVPRSDGKVTVADWLHG
mmetsp:Transcript_35598/g.90685  ORF Transcript_35598/g.90685 Transcript_35598/m.90685 type:complete len:101 (+) Transcript_35598:1832-2134(+)